MWTDPIIEDLRKESEQYAAQFNFDLTQMFQDLQKKQSPEKLVAFPPKRLSVSLTSVNRTAN